MCIGKPIVVAIAGLYLSINLTALAQIVSDGGFELGAPKMLSNFFVDCAGIALENACPWDLDGNGNVGAADLLALLVKWGRVLKEGIE